MEISHEDMIRFWRNVSASSPSRCWEWVGGKRGKYGGFYLTSQKVYCTAHRVAYMLHYGEIPEGMSILHSCDNKKCVNPHHLRAGTHVDNARDAVERKRYRPRVGSAVWAAKITEADVVEIRQRAANGRRGICAQLAREYGISSSTIYQIVNGISWAHVK